MLLVCFFGKIREGLYFLLILGIYKKSSDVFESKLLKYRGAAAHFYSTICNNIELENYKITKENMNTQCPHCNRDLAFKILPRKNLGQTRNGMKISTPICNFCKQPLAINFAPLENIDILKDLSACLVGAVGFIYSLYIGSMAIGITSVFLGFSLGTIFFIQKSKKYSDLPKYSKYDASNL